MGLIFGFFKLLGGLLLLLLRLALPIAIIVTAVAMPPRPTVCALSTSPRRIA